MTDSQTLDGLTILVAEDEALIALDIEMVIEDFGGRVIGPYGTLEQVLDAVETGGFDIALLDIMLGRDEVFPAAERLRTAGIPFAFHSGHGVPTLNGGLYEHTPTLHKPCLPEKLASALVQLSAARGSATAN